MKKTRWWIPKQRHSSQMHIKQRLRKADPRLSIALGRCLRYLYGEKRNIDRATIRLADGALEQAEKLLIRFLQTRSSGSEKKRYGHSAVLEAKAARFRCRKCNHGDVRSLTLDHVDGKGSTRFQLLCANCHMIKSRLMDWTGISRKQRDGTAYAMGK